MILKQSRDNKTVATYETEEAAVKENRLSLALLRSHLNSKKPKYLDGFVYVVSEKDATAPAPPPVVDEITFPAQTVSTNLGSASTVPPEGLFSQLPFVTQEDSELKFAGKKVGDVAPSDKLSDTLAGEINFNQPGADAYDGARLDRVVMDEAGMWPEAKDGIPFPDDYQSLRDTDPEPSLPGKEQGFDLRTIASKQLCPEPSDAEIETDFNLTPMQKRAKELKKRPPL